MKHLVSFSGGKDSLATIIWANKTLSDFQIVFCDVGWENPKTYEHIKEIERWSGKEIKVLASEKFKGLIDLFIQKKRAASSQARFCTEEMKVKPMIDFILTHEEDITVIQGVRNDESEARSTLKASDEFFKFYFEPYGYDDKGKPKYHTYRKAEILAYCEKYVVDVFRPVLKNTAQEVFEMIFSSGLKANPLYYEGFSRVGCFPCVMANHLEIKLIAENYKETIAEIRAYELLSDQTFFRPGYIPSRFCTKRVVTKKGRKVMVPTIDDVVKYVCDDANQGRLFTKTTGCISVYNICDSSGPNRNI